MTSGAPGGNAADDNEERVSISKDSEWVGDDTQVVDEPIEGDDVPDEQGHNSAAEFDDKEV